eukprot:COSAG01_NODE_1909_length_8928_cov_64.180315_11_plen_155_part_00
MGFACSESIHIRPGCVTITTTPGEHQAHPACVASPVHAHGSQTDSCGWGACWAASRRLLAGARRYAPSLRLHKGDINAVEAGARAWRIRSGRDRGDPGASGRAAIAARAHAPGDIRSRAGSVDQSRARRRAASIDQVSSESLIDGPRAAWDRHR